MTAFTMRQARADALTTSWSLRYLPVPSRPGWQTRAACRGLPADMFCNDQPGRGLHVSPELAHLCAGCPVRLDCLRDAAYTETKDPVLYGVRGGLSGPQRLAVRRQMSAA